MIVSRRFSFFTLGLHLLCPVLQITAGRSSSSSDHSYRLRLTSRWFWIRSLRSTPKFATMVWQVTPQNVKNILLVIPLSCILFWCGKGIVEEGLLTDISDWIYIYINISLPFVDLRVAGKG